MGLKIVLVEDELPARKRITSMLSRYRSDIEVIAELESVKQGVQWFTAHKEPDLILLDIQLKDGLSHRIFEQVRPTCPVIFITAFDHHMHKAFQYHCIDYLLKPIKEEHLFLALDKLNRNKKHFMQNVKSFMEVVEQPNMYPKRIMLTKGLNSFPTKLDEVAYFFTEHKVVFAVLIDKHKYSVRWSLTDLEAMLKPSMFFRVNRQYIVSKEGVASISHLPKGKLQVVLKPTINQEVLVNQPKAVQFQQWLLA